MSLYLSRLCLNPLYAPALKLASDPYALRCKLLATLPCVAKEKPHIERQPRTADLLFRVEATDSGPIVLIQTSARPAWDTLELAPRALRCAPESKEYAPRFAPETRLAFRLLCVPSVRKAGDYGQKPNGKRRCGPRRACRTDEQRLEWLKNKSRGCGFLVETVGLSLFEWRSTKPLEASGGVPVETPEQARKRAFGPEPYHRLGAVRFDGTLVVTHPDRLHEAVRWGIGPGKAFGMGMLSLARS